MLLIDDLEDKLFLLSMYPVLVRLMYEPRMLMQRNIFILMRTIVSFEFDQYKCYSLIYTAEVESQVFFEEP